MPTEQTVQKQEDYDFFHQVSEQPKFVTTLSNLGFVSPRFYVTLGNAGMIITRPTGPSRCLRPHTRSTSISARARTEFRIEVGPEPHVASIDRKPDIIKRFAPLLARRAEIMDALRQRLLSAGSVPSDIIVSTSSLLRSTSTAAHTIVKFQTALPTDPTPAQTAAFFCSVMEAVTPTVDEVKENRQ